MPRNDDTSEEQPHRLTHVIYNSALGHVRVRAEDGLTTTVEVPSDDVRFRRVMGAAEPEVPLWLDSNERDYLSRMLEHVLRALRITPEAREALAAIRTKMEELGPPPIMASDGNPDSATDTASRILEEPPPPPLPGATRASTMPSPDADESAGAPPAIAPHRQRVRGGRSARSADAEHTEQAPSRRGPESGPEEPGSAANPGQTEQPPGPPTAAPRRRAAGNAAPADSRAAREPASVNVEPAIEPPQVTLDGTDEPITFETVWQDLHALVEHGPALHALAGQASSEIREVSDDGIWLYSHGLGREYLIGRDLLEVAWAVLAQHGVLVPRELRGAMSYGAATLLAHLPYVEYSADPITLYFPGLVGHPLGTVRRRDL
jgi:hypothetical protein